MTKTAATAPVLRTVKHDRDEFAALVSDFLVAGLDLPRYSRMLMLSKRIARRTNTNRNVVMAQAGMV